MWKGRSSWKGIGGREKARGVMSKKRERALTAATSSLWEGICISCKHALKIKTKGKKKRSHTAAKTWGIKIMFMYKTNEENETKIAKT